MKNGLKIQRILEANPLSWKDVLTNPPYSLKINEDENLVIFNYDMIRSDKSNKAVQEARGLILEKNTWEIVCHPFNKFFNYGESNAHVINWKNAVVQEKIDGSLIKVYFYKKWRVATNGTINAFNAPVQSDLYNGTFGDLFVKAFSKYMDFKNLNENICYFFELVSPYTRIVIPYSETDIYFLGQRNRRTDEEEYGEFTNFKRPEIYPINSIEDCLKAAEILPYDKEGYVVVDNKFHRVKVKSPAYLAEHHLKNNGSLTKKRIIDLIKIGRDDDFIGKFPEFKEDIEKVRNSYRNFIISMDKSFEEIKGKSFADRKSFALAVKDTKNPAFFFQWYDGKVKNFEEYVNNSLDSEDIAKII